MTLRHFNIPTLLFVEGDDEKCVRLDSTDFSDWDVLSCTTRTSIVVLCESTNCNEIVHY